MKKLIVFLVVFVVLFFLGHVGYLVLEKFNHMNEALEQAEAVEGERLNGEHVEYYKSGAVMAVGKYRDGTYDGTWIQYYENGDTMLVTTYDKGEMVNMQAYDPNGRQTIKDCSGKAALYYPNGKLMSVATYKDCQLHGPSLSYFENGLKESETYYESGKAAGTWRFYNSKGELVEETDYSE